MEKSKHGQIRENEYAKFLTFYCHIKDSESGKEVYEQEICFNNYNEKYTEAPGELAIHIIQKMKEGDQKTYHLLTMLPKWEKEKLRKLLS